MHGEFSICRPPHVAVQPQQRQASEGAVPADANLLDEAERRAYTVAGTSQDMGSGKSMARMGLKQMMRAVKDGLAQAVLVQNLTRLSHDPAILMKILEFLQDHNAVLITTESDLQYELYIKGLEKHFLRRAAQKGLRLPW